MVPELIPVLGSQPAGVVRCRAAYPAVGCHYFPPGMQLPPQPLRGLLPISLLGEQRHDGCEQFAWDCYPTASRLRVEPGPSAPESSTLTTRLPSYPVTPELSCHPNDTMCKLHHAEIAAHQPSVYQQVSTVYWRPYRSCPHANNVENIDRKQTQYVQVKR